ncbi:GntR family transcriptional regulator [Cryptosporangium sp. NPDC048952]|uniref:GntR family transcriptional regulator n=1 Tax=Cryptosporangium sp. NPDC048952 TaxID=3363961 RepID=UPI00371C2EC7
MTIDPHADRAMYRQLSDLLGAGIRSGKYQPGMPIPSEAMLMERHGVARNTVRLAMEVLRDQGLVVTRHGRGTFVRTDEDESAQNIA